MPDTVQHGEEMNMNVCSVYNIKYMRCKKIEEYGSTTLKKNLEDGYILLLLPTRQRYLEI